ncbi:hypothetical protein [Mucilaginibacter sp. KACC 22063]|uniref:hypothetical protein n=1 Tax=Mucilaginibacter sp. KACC 22063 TaxID=3025666 RepID=UPI0023658C10|nr:hypothetical protein [Mucilaginibacter sp. KACC 22063]WDF56297.1 hypothetical protein PQ461_04380 [Mucilaginibacter sp. KACC 22063]
MKHLKLFIVLLFVGLSLLQVKQAKAQCAMCTATVDANSKSNENKTNGLNNGILFLLAAPYLAVAVGGYIWYKKYRRKDVELNMRNEKIHLN